MPWEDSRLAEGVSGAAVWREPCSGLSWHFAACVHTCVHVYTGKHQHRHLAKKVRTCLTCPRGIWCWFACPLSFKIPWRWQYLQAAYNFVQFQVEVARLPSQCLNDSRHMSLLNPTPHTVVGNVTHYLLLYVFILWHMSWWPKIRKSGVLSVQNSFTSLLTWVSYSLI